MSIFEIKDDNGMRGLILHKGSFKPGDIIYILSGPVLDQPTQTSIKVSDSAHIEDEWGKYINHSCLPTVKIEGFNLVSLTHLKCGDQITFNYLDNEDELVIPFYCKCCGKLIY